MSEQTLSKVDWTWILITLSCGLVSGGLQLQWALGLTPLPTEFIVIVGGPFGLVWLVGMLGCLLRFPLKALGIFLLTLPTLIGPYMVLGVFVSCSVFGRCI